jgi:hypothetical protein
MEIHVTSRWAGRRWRCHRVGVPSWKMTLYQAGRYTFVTHALGDSTLGAMGRFIAK